jgi:hypothetical protein
MKLGLKSSFVAPKNVEPVNVSIEHLDVYSRIMETPRVSGNNQTLGDCFPTGCVNAVQTVMGLAGHYSPIPNTAAVAAYEGMAGYVLGQPETDQGTDPIEGFAWWQANPIAGYKLNKLRSLPIKFGEGEIRDAILRTGGVGLCLSLSVEQQNQRVWMPAGTPGSWGGHFVWADSYEGDLTKITSWGEEFYIDRSYFDAPGFVVAVYELSLAAMN